MTDKIFKFPCGCSFPVLREPRFEGDFPLLDFRIDDAPPDCPKVFEILSRGDTKGVFQLESSLGRQWTRRLRPTTQAHLAALGSILRPGCLQAVDEEGISMTEHYCRRKNSEEETPSLHPVVDEVLHTTYGVIAFQEQFMKLSRLVAGFDELAADKLRKASGKKHQDEMVEVGKAFHTGVRDRQIISSEQGELLWSWIKESGRYSFNLAHATSYGLTGYDSAYVKCHFPAAFFLAWNEMAKHESDPRQELYELVQEAKKFDIKVAPPDLRDAREEFYARGDTVVFGLAHVKGIGSASVKKVRELVKDREEKLGRPLAQWCWTDFLFCCAGELSKAVLPRLIQCGALDFFRLPRQWLLEEYEAWEALKDGERKWVLAQPEGFPTLVEALRAAGRMRREGGGAANAKRVSAVQSHADLLAARQLKPDPAYWLAWQEQELLGIALTASPLDGCATSEIVNCTCKDFLAGKSGKVVLAVQVGDVRVLRTRRGQNPGQQMAYLTVSDQSGFLADVVCFPDAWKEHAGLLTRGNLVYLEGVRGRKKQDVSLVVTKVFQASLSDGAAA